MPLSINGQSVSIADSLSIPGQAFGGQQINVARDGRCREGVTVAAANVEHYSKTPRTPDSFAMCLADVALRESEAKTWLEGVAAVVERHGRQKYVPRLLQLEKAPMIHTFLCSRQRYTTGSSSNLRRCTTHHEYAVNPRGLLDCG